MKRILPKGEALEKPHMKKIRTMAPKPVPAKADPPKVWSSLEAILPEPPEAAQLTPRKQRQIAVKRTGSVHYNKTGISPKAKRCMLPPSSSSIGAIVTPVDTRDPSPEVASTSVAAAAESRPTRRSTQRQVAVKRTGSTHYNETNSGPKPKRGIIPLSSSSSNCPPSPDDEVSNVANLHIGSEEDSDSDLGDEEIDLQPTLVPRAARMFMDDFAEEGRSRSTNAYLSLQWPPQPRSKLAALSLVPSPELGLNLETEPTSQSELNSEPGFTFVLGPAFTLKPEPTELDFVVGPEFTLEPEHAPETVLTPEPKPAPETELELQPEPTPKTGFKLEPELSPKTITLENKSEAASERGSTLEFEPHVTSCQPESGSKDAVQFKPITKFDFEWRPFSKSEIQPELRREPFSKINCGPTIKLDNPYEAFTAIWDRKIMNDIATETNRYAQQLVAGMMKEGLLTPSSRITRWQDTDINELYIYFAIILASGIVVKSRIEEYWNRTGDIFSTPGFTASMTYDRFYLLNKCLHFQNNASCNPEIMSPAEARLYKLKPILDHLNKKFPLLYNLSQNIALDESLVMWKGWLDINQFISNKKAAVGIKTYEVCESTTGYLWRFEVHTGHDETSNPREVSPISGIVPNTVLRLLDGLEHKGHTVWMDNYYNSPALARELKNRGFDCVGTLRTNRQGVPPELVNLKMNDMEVGQVCGCTSGDVDLVVWRDKNLVALVSTYHGLASVKCGDSLKPSMVPDYNIYMAGVDRKDQMLAMYPIERKRTQIWYKKLFRRLLNVSVLNGYILLKAQRPIVHRNFRKILVKELIERHGTSKILPAVALPATVGHFVDQYDFIVGKQHKQQDRLRRLCVFCKRKRTTTYCKACKVALCIFTCFEPYHLGQKLDSDTKNTQ